MKKRIGIIFLVMVLILSSFVVNAADATNKTAVEAKHFHIQLNGKLVSAEATAGTTAYPMVIDGVSYLPLKALGNLLGITVTYDNPTRTIMIDTKTKITPIYGADTKTQTGVNKKAVEVKDMAIELNGSITFPRNAAGDIVYPIIVDGRSYLPLRAVGPLLGIKVDYDNPSKTITIATDGYVEVAKDGYSVESEGNDTIKTANPLPVNGGKMKGVVGETIQSEQDLDDYFKLDFTQSGVFTYTVAGANEAQLSIYLVSKENHTIYSDDMPYEDNYTFSIAVKPGTYFLELRSHSGAASYKIDTSFKAYPQDIELNDEYEKATAAKVNTSITGTLGGADDLGGPDNSDWYYISDSTTSSLSYTLNAKFTTEITLYDKEGYHIDSAQTHQGTVSGTFTNDDPENVPAPYYICITGYPDFSDGPNEYTFTLK
ncbi:MAG: hypothetical protein CVU84_10460 [Firmicutes bacterium HGW-Firmicutes-1]|jgi:uncharacterized protein YpmB|nr:MAG: hypothetical protein CVU84_10460 [Firmicutes bacterium HGW-Firmicutes-1]